MSQVDVAELTPPVGNQTYPVERKTARVTGLWYLALALAGGIGFLLIRPQIYVAGEPSSTLANLVDEEGLARIGMMFELLLVVTQSVAAIWFFKLFHRINHTAAWAVAAFGLMNAAAIMASAVFLATALGVAGSPVAGLDPAGTAQMMYELSANSWGVGGLFFGLWLIPIGYLVITSGRMPQWLGRILIFGGFGYVLGTFVQYGLADAPVALVDAFAYPATIGEVWMIGYLLIVGIRSAAKA
jgi:hypothetical protein